MAHGFSMSVRELRRCRSRITRSPRRTPISDVRTDLFPMYPVEAPHMEWRSQFGAAPQLDPARLCELWVPADMERALRPLADGYGAWLQHERSRIASLPESDHPIAEENL